MKPKQKSAPIWLLPDLIESYERTLRARNLSPNTIRSYLTTCRLFAVYRSEHTLTLDVAAITQNEIRQFVADMLDIHTDTTSQLYIITLRNFFHWCVDEDIIATFPMEKMQKIKVVERLPHVLSDDDLKALFKTCTNQKDFQDVRDLAIMRLLLDTGVRASEMSELPLDHLDMKQQCLKIFGKGSKWRWCSFGNKTATVLDRYLRFRAQHTHKDSPYVWLGQRGGMSHRTLHWIIDQRAKQAGLPHTHPHLFRHTFIDRMKRSGMLEEDIMQLTGHSSTDVFQHYAKTLRADRAMNAYRNRAPGDQL